MMQRSATKRIAVAAILLFATAAGCASKSSGPSAIQTKLMPSAKPLQDAVAKQATVKSNQLLFPRSGNDELVNVQPGAVLTSGVGDGFIRRVNSVSVDPAGTTIAISTEPATLLDVVEEGESNSTIDFATVAPEGWRTWPGVHPLDNGQPGFNVSLDEKVIWADKKLGVNVRVTQGDFQFIPKLDVGVTVKDGLSFRAVASGHLKVDIHVEASCRQSLPQSTYQIELWRSPKFKVPMPSIGLVKVVVDARLFVRAGIEISASGEITFNGGVTTEVDAEYGVTYDGDNGWQKVGSIDTAWTPDGPTVSAMAEIHSLAYVSGGVELGFFGGLNLFFVKAGVSGNAAVALDPYVQFDYASANAPPWAMRAGLRGQYWANLKVLGASVKDVEPTVLFDNGKQIAPTAESTEPPVATNNCGSVESDCGGTCTPCADGRGCEVDQDCQSANCLDGACAKQQPAHCTNGQKDSDETGIDCGGSCLACYGASCNSGSDCSSADCTQAAEGLMCGTPPTCFNATLDPGESDVDCGGVCDPVLRCIDGQRCSTDADCQGGSCAGACASLPENCMDSVQDGDETDVDCGGVACARCGAGKACTSSGDCASGGCAGGVCQSEAADAGTPTDDAGSPSPEDGGGAPDDGGSPE